MDSSNYNSSFVEELRLRDAWFYVVDADVSGRLPYLALVSGCTLPKTGKERDLYYHEVCLKSDGTPLLINPFTVELNGKVIFTVDDPQIIAIVTSRLLV